MILGPPGAMVEGGFLAVNQYGNGIACQQHAQASAWCITEHVTNMNEATAALFCRGAHSVCCTERHKALLLLQLRHLHRLQL